MDTRKFALTFGISSLVVGLASLIPSLVGSTEALPMLDINVSYGRFLDLFALNVMNKGALISMGIFGILAATAKTDALGRSIEFAKATAMVTGAMGLLGLIPQTNTLFGYWPLFGSYNVMASLVIAAVSGFFGYMSTSPARKMVSSLGR